MGRGKIDLEIFEVNGLLNYWHSGNDSKSKNASFAYTVDEVCTII